MGATTFCPQSHAVFVENMRSWYACMSLGPTAIRVISTGPTGPGHCAGPFAMQNCQNL
jgi:hypothetical protein